MTEDYADADKMQRIREWRQPRSYLDIQRFLGLVQYMSQFLPDLTAYTGPLVAMTRNGALFAWRPLCCLRNSRQAGGYSSWISGRSRKAAGFFPRSLALLFGGDINKPVEKPRCEQFTREALLMELLAAEESDESPDDGALSGSGDEYEE
ncbi:hypothetical protein B0H13DRAFT_2360670 [Mycena leptocephala]|nr:hypothetical protein B0H13DRAFT_2360670 [Mycena leptocephala]